jgi:hypothetical protein
VLRSFFDLQAVIKRFVAQSNDIPKALRLDRRSRQDHRRCPAWVPSPRFNPLSPLDVRMIALFREAGHDIECGQISIDND